VDGAARFLELMQSAMVGAEAADVTSSRGQAPEVPTATLRWLTLPWALLPLAYGLPAGPCFAWAAWRLRSRALAAEAAAYLAATVLWIALVNERATVELGVTVLVAVAVVACVRAFLVRRRLLSQLRSQAKGPMPRTLVRLSDDPRWTPVFPAQRLRENGQTLASSVVCNGHDSHRLSMSVRQAVPGAVGGVALIGLAIHLHSYGRGLGAGIALLLLPLIAPSFAQWVDGQVLYYRSWGRLHHLALNDITMVTATNRRQGRGALLLSAPGLAKPLRVRLHSRGYVMPTAARDHLRGWLSAPHVQWTPEAVGLLNGDSAPSATRGGAHRRAFRWVLTGVLLLCLAGTAVWLVSARDGALPIPGAPGYSTFTGPHGDPLPVGRPWGRPCQPIRFVAAADISGWVYAQMAAVVGEARRDGVDVALEDRQFFWTPSSLYYVDGQSPVSTVPVTVLGDSRPAPQLSNGDPEHIDLGWNTRLDPDGRHEDLTGVQGTLWMQSLNSNAQAVRRAMRQLIAMTQGIISTTRGNSGIENGNGIDEFTPADIAAMKRMSGCG
jgi:hypothetical protein